MCATSKGTVLRTVVVARNKGIRRRTPTQANETEVEDVSVVVFEVNFISSNTKEWWVDTGAIHHVCSDKKMFSSY